MFRANFALPKTFGGKETEVKQIIFGLNLILFFSLSAFSQQQKTNPDSVDKQRQPVKQKSQKNQKNEQNNEVLLQAGTSLEAQLQQTLDVKKVSVGDEVILKTTKSIKQNGQTVVEKGSRLVGRITEVQQKTKAGAQSKLSVVFDRLEGKNLNAPISASIVSITQANAGAGLGDAFDTDVSESSTTSGRASGNGSGGGLLGGVVNTTANTVGGVTNTATGAVGGTTQTLGRTLGGIRLSQSSSTSAEGASTLSLQNSNLRLEKGVLFQLRLNQSVEN